MSLSLRALAVRGVGFGLRLQAVRGYWHTTAVPIVSIARKFLARALFIKTTPDEVTMKTGGEDVWVR